MDITTDRAAAYPRVLDELVPATRQVTERYANNSIEADHKRLTSRLRPMRGLTQLRLTHNATARVHDIHVYQATAADSVATTGPGKTADSC